MYGENSHIHKRIELPPGATSLPSWEVFMQKLSDFCSRLCPSSEVQPFWGTPTQELGERGVARLRKQKLQEQRHLCLKGEEGAASHHHRAQVAWGSL